MKLDEIRALCEAATPGPWSVPGENELTDDIIRGLNDYSVAGSCCCGGFQRDEDAQLITAARTLLPLLLDVATSAKEFINEFELDSSCICCQKNEDLAQMLAEKIINLEEA